MTWMKRVILFSVCFPISAICAPYYGTTMSYGLIGKEPETVRGFQLMFNYDPQYFKWRQFNVYFDGGASYFWITTTSYYSSLNVFSAAPVIRYTFKRHWLIHPFLEISIGLAYLNHTRLDNRNLGIHFAFQDRMGVGTFVGRTDKISVGLHSVHYSNAHLSKHNSGITLPLVLDVSYRFN